MLRPVAVLCSILAVWFLATPVSAVLMVAHDRLTGSNAVYSDNGEYVLRIQGFNPGGTGCFSGANYLKFARTDGGNLPSNYLAYWISKLDGSVHNQYNVGAGDHMNQTGCLGASLLMQGDGNLVYYADYEETDAIWYTSTEGNSGAYLNVQNDGNLVVYSANDTALWSVW